MIVWLYILMGMAGIGGQVLLLRRAMVSFGGNEVTVAALLAAWTAWTGIGSWLGGKLEGILKSGGVASADGLFEAVFAAVFALLPATYVAAYLIKPIMGVEIIEAVGPFKVVAVSFLLVCPLCLSLGALFPLGASAGGGEAGRAVTRAYLWEALGAGLGGLLAGAVLLPYTRPLAAVFALDAILAASFAVIGKGGRRVLWALGAVLAMTGVLWPLPDGLIQSIRWKGFPLSFEGDSQYANLALVERDDESTLFIDGAPSITWPGRAPAEELALLPLSAHPKPRRVLLIGGGETVVGAQILKAGIERLDYCQLDPAIVNIEERAEGAAPRDERVKVHLADGRRFLESAPPASYDVIILAGGDPSTLARNRYFTVEMFRSARRALARPGVMAFATGEYENYVEPLQAEYLASLRASLESVFDKTAIYPLERFYFLAGVGLELPETAGAITRSLDDKGIETRYFRPEFLAFNLTQERRSSVRRAINSIKEPQFNRDFHPVGYSLWTAYWSTLFSDLELRAFKAVRALRPAAGLAATAILLILGLLYVRGGGGGRGMGVLVACLGFGEMMISIALLYYTQARLGALFSLMAWVITALMAGLSVGAWLVSVSPERHLRRLFFATAILMILLPVALLPAMYMPLMAGSDMAVITLLTAMAFGSSAVAGAFYAAAARVERARESRAGRLGGRINGADLLGGAAGALLGGTVMIPLWGFPAALSVASLVMAAGMAVWLAGQRSTAGARKGG